MSEPTELEQREGLPEALRALVKTCPREIWQGRASFRGLVSLWLGRQLMFRKIMATRHSDAQTFLDGGSEVDTCAARLSRLGGMLEHDLHGHQQIEDMHYFPLPARTETSVARGFENLDADHHAIDHHLDRFVKGANGTLVRRDDAEAFRTRTGRFSADLAGLAARLNRHLLDEEDLVGAVILKHGPDGLRG